MNKITFFVRNTRLKTRKQLEHMVTLSICYSIGGGELFDRVIEDEFVLTEKACAAFMRQIVEAVAYIHKQHIIHLDLKVTIQDIFAEN